MARVEKEGGIWFILKNVLSLPQQNPFASHKNCIRVIFFMANKKARTIQEQIVLLRDRGLQIKEERIAASYLEHISYYRLKGYWWNMQENLEQHIFKPGSCFEDVIERYNFDRELRQILFDAIEVIEVSLRANLINCMSCGCSQEGLWYLSSEFFESENYFLQNLEKLRREFARSQEVFAKDFREKHQSKYEELGK
ncbi:MAG: Abi family protein [Bacteroidales bacterium]|nr:Abi family protein [Bacteroidales bacterium]